MDLYALYQFASSTPAIIVMLIVLLFCIAEIQEILTSKKDEKLSIGIFQLIRSLRFEKLIHCLIIVLYLICAFITLFSCRQIVYLMGCNDIRIMPSGTYCYNAYLTSEKGATYLLPVNVYKSDNTYSVYNAYFDNGGYLYFRGTAEDIEYDETALAYDQNDREWEIKLTNRKSSHPYVIEEFSFDVFGLIICLAFFVIFILSVFLHSIIFFSSLRE